MDNFLIFARRSDIRAMSLDVDYHADIVLYSKGLENAIAVDVDPLEGKI